MSPTLRYLLKPISQFLEDPSVEECCINAPGEAFVYSKGGFACHPVDLDAGQIEDIAHYAAAARRQDVSSAFPLLSTELPDGERLQAVLPPCVGEGKPVLTIRKHSSFAPTLDGLAEAGIFKRTVRRKSGLTTADRELVRLHREERWLEFFKLASRSGKSVVLCGANAAGKTTVAKAYVNEIPLHERLITIEDTSEWHDLPHRNRVALFYSKGGQGVTKVGPNDLVEAALRMRIGRLLLQELRDSAAYSFVRALASGHPGLSTCHAPDAEGAFKALTMMVKEHSSAANRPDEAVEIWLRGLIDIVVHCDRVREGDSDQFGISEVWYAPAMEEAHA